MTKYTYNELTQFGFQPCLYGIDLDNLTDSFLELDISDDIKLQVNILVEDAPLVIEKLNKITNKKTVINDDEFLEYHKEFREIYRRKSQYAQLSKIDPDLSIDDLINYLLDNGFKGIINDLSGNGIEYDIVDLITVINCETIWSILSNELKRNNLPNSIYPI